jgi:hypothetical protein
MKSFDPLIWYCNFVLYVVCPVAALVLAYIVWNMLTS